jgi:hypothetical protein
MFAKMKRVLKIGALLGFILFISLQVLNVRSPITIGEAQADSGARVKGFTYVSNRWGQQSLGGVKVTLCNPGGTPYIVYSSNGGYGNPPRGYFEFPRTHTTANGGYQIIFEKSGYSTVSKNYNMDQFKGAIVTALMVGTGNSTVGISPFFPWY